MPLKTHRIYKNEEFEDSEFILIFKLIAIEVLDERIWSSS